ncbi:low molecular weight protein-tyrosine-phosphatase [Nocardioides alkalitolerans]|uniref:low molecular weight protein-tyrosine-phosphatase n=1 Tax=Nocardioides alkalitolerans TaxID=281714 RepID=UPI0004104976|nr:low molecular weight protein-tyrosine-phosphatase [Nocardioides alkalitolerans]
MTTAPAGRGPAPYRVAVVCLGNICRSPIAHVVLADRVAAAGLDVEVVSAGTAGWHVGKPMDERSAHVLTQAGYDASRHRGRQVTAGDLDALDLVLAMDTQNLADLRDLGAPDDRLLLFRAFDPEGPGDVDDPYYGGADGFTTTLAVVERTADALVDALAAVAPAAPAAGGAR